MQTDAGMSATVLGGEGKIAVIFILQVSVNSGCECNEV